jgi:1,4-dihydroxy-2-naphthoate octaprenyltransferase
MANRWVLGARVRTLPASAVPVVVGTAAAAADGRVIWWRAFAALVVAVALQVGTNYANDYSDGVRGTDEQRVGPVRLVASGLASAPAVKRAAMIAFGVAAVAGLALAAAAGWGLIAVGAVSIAAGWLYTGGPRPYGYYGFGELFVFIFFGLVATVGSTWVQLERVTPLAVVTGGAVGLLAVALLVVNNLRDIDGDRAHRKRTLAVRLGRGRTRRLYSACVLLPFVVPVVIAPWFPLALLAELALPMALAPARQVRRGADGKALIAVLIATGRLQLAFGALLAVGLAA